MMHMNQPPEPAPGRQLIARTEQVPVDQLIPHPKNPKVGDIDQIAASLTIHGQYRPIVVQTSTKHVLAGNHTLAAAKSLGWTDIAVAWVDVDDDQALRILLVDNRTSDLGRYDNDTLAELLGELEELEGTGFTFDDLEDLLPAAEPDPEPPAPRPAAAQRRVAPFTLTFDGAEQRKVWQDHLARLANLYPDEPTIAARVARFITDHAPEAES